MEDRSVPRGAAACPREQTYRGERLLLGQLRRLAHTNTLQFGRRRIVVSRREPRSAFVVFALPFASRWHNFSPPPSIPRRKRQRRRGQSSRGSPTFSLARERKISQETGRETGPPDAPDSRLRLNRGNAWQRR